MVTSSLHEVFSGIEFSRYVCALLDATASTPPQRDLTVQLAISEQLVSVVK